MQLTEYYRHVVSDGAAVKTAALSDSSQGAALLENGEIIAFNCITGQTARLASFAHPENNAGSADGTFSIAADCSLLIMDDIVVVVNDRETHGYVMNQGRGYLMPLSRGDYRAEITLYPVALYKDEAGTPHLIYGSDWNRVDILNLSTLEILTASKSLIDEQRERWNREQSEKYSFSQEQRDLQRSDLDYFYGRLIVSPDNRYFLSRGWRWGSADSLGIFAVNDFIHNNCVRYQSIGFGSHENRPACWVSKSTIAFTYSPLWEGDDDSWPKNEQQIHFFHLSAGEDQERQVLNVPGLIRGELYFSQRLQVFVAFSPDDGIIIFNRSGEVMLRDETVRPLAFYPDTDCLLSIVENALVVHRLA